MTTELTLEQVKEQIRTIQDFPKPGIQFKDITTALKEPETITFLADTISDLYMHKGITKIVCLESRGFILGGAIACKIGAGFIPVRKPGKLPAPVYSKAYSLEYGTDAIEIHKDALSSNDVVLIHDDLLATGGTALATVKLLKNFRPKKVYLNFFCELDFLNGREALKDYEISSLIHF